MLYFEYRGVDLVLSRYESLWFFLVEGFKNRANEIIPKYGISEKLNSYIFTENILLMSGGRCKISLCHILRWTVDIMSKHVLWNYEKVRWVQPI